MGSIWALYWPQIVPSPLLLTCQDVSVLCELLVPQVLLAMQADPIETSSHSGVEEGITINLLQGKLPWWNGERRVVYNFTPKTLSWKKTPLWLQSRSHSQRYSQTLEDSGLFSMLSIRHPCVSVRGSFMR